MIKIRPAVLELGMFIAGGPLLFLPSIYQSLAVAEQYVLYHDLDHSFWKIFIISLKTEQNSAHNIGLIHTTQKTKVTMTYFFYDTSGYNAFSQHVNCILN